MNQKRTISILVFLIIIISIAATSLGIFSGDGPGQYQYKSIRGENIEIYGTGIYHHMSADVAIQGIAQDYVTLFIAVPLLLIFLLGYRKNSLKSHFLLTGTMGYFFVTYLFYTAMGMYNIMYLAYVTLLGLSFFGLVTSLISFDILGLKNIFRTKTPTKFAGGFLVFNSVSIALLWLSIVVPPLLDGTIYPSALQHYTTLIVQGFDLGLLLPLAFISGLLLIKKTPLGYLSSTVYLVFLSFLMTALTAKIIAMALHGVNVIPAVFIIPAFNLIAILCAWLMIRSVNSR